VTKQPGCSPGHMIQTIPRHYCHASGTHMAVWVEELWMCFLESIAKYLLFIYQLNSLVN
jgi:hypothetical protein